MSWRKLLAVAFAVALSAQTASATVSTFTGGDIGEGLDLDGTFLYAVAKNDFGPVVAIRDATFTADNATPGVTISNWLSELNGWSSPGYGATTNDNNLESVMNSIRHAGALPGTGRLDMTVIPGVQYKLQMLWQESLNTNRGFDIFIEGVNVQDNFQPAPVATPFPTFGTVFTHEFTAGDVNLDIDLVGVTGEFTDTNPTFFAATLEVVPEPSSSALVCLTAAATSAIGRRRR